MVKMIKNRLFLNQNDIFWPKNDENLCQMISKSLDEAIVEPAATEGMREIESPIRAVFIPRMTIPKTHQASILRRRCSNNSVFF